MRGCRPEGPVLRTRSECVYSLRANSRQRGEGTKQGRRGERGYGWWVWASTEQLSTGSMGGEKKRCEKCLVR